VDGEQAAEVSRRQLKARETTGNLDNAMKLQAAETKLQELKTNMAVLGKEAAVAMAAVEAQQQRLTLQRLIAMVCILFSTLKLFSLSGINTDIFNLES
jgi:chromosome segregation ATPase